MSNNRNHSLHGRLSLLTKGCKDVLGLDVPSYLPPPSISTCKLSNDGSLRMRAVMSVHNPIEQMSELVCPSTWGVMSTHAISCSISVVL